MHVLPGDPTELMLAGAEGGSISKERLNQIRSNLGLDRPLHIQYADFVINALQGDLGESIRYRMPVVDILLEKFPYTLRISFLGLLVAIVVGISTGFLAALYKDTWIDSTFMTISLIGVSMPIFWLGLLSILLFSFNMKLLPASGATSIVNDILPAATLGFVSSGLISRLFRNNLIEVFNQDYIRTAWAKGLPGRLIYWKHSIKNALIPVITILGLQFGNMLAGAVVTETVFSRPGIGRLLVNGILWKDYPLVQGTILFVASTYVIVNYLVDITYAYINPKIKYK